jgi:hypothetical protein
MSNIDVRQLLESTGAATTGFNTRDEGTPVLRVDVNAALTAASGVRVNPPHLTKLLQSGTVTFTPEVFGEPDFVQAYLNSELVGTATEEPYSFEVDTTGIQFGRATVEFRAYKDDEVDTKLLDILIDNTGGSFPILENFDGGPLGFASFDARCSRA